MIGFAVCVGDRAKFAAHAEASVARVREADSVLAELTAETSIHAAYNGALDHFGAIEELEALVLLHDDVELRPADFCARVRAALRDPEVAVVGAVGARDVRSLAWWRGTRAGRIPETRGTLNPGFENPDVDTVDGLLLVLSPWAVRNLRFDTETYEGFHGYDADFCFTARAAGKRVVVADLDVVHHTKTGYGDRTAWERADAAFRRKWQLAEPTVGSAGASRPPASIVVVLDGGATRALRCLESLAALDDDQPEHEIVIVDDASTDLAPVLARLDGDVNVLRTERRVGFAAAAALGAGRACGEAVVVLRDAPIVAAGFLTPLVAALGDGGRAAAAAAIPEAAATHAVATHALAFHRDRRDAFDGVPTRTPDALAFPALCVELARHGRIDVVAASAVAPPSARAGGLRREPGEEVELTVVIPTLDAASERLRRCVAAVQATTDVPHEIVVVDNGAPPQGFTAPVNAGLRAARGRYALVLNDDVELLPGWWEPLRDALDGGAAVAFPLTIDGAMRRDFAAWCFALSRETLDAYEVRDGEFLDPSLVVWYQDTDLLERLRRDGRPPVCVEASRIRHGLSETVGSEDPVLRAWVERQIRDDKAAFEAKHGMAVAGAAH